MSYIVAKVKKDAEYKNVYSGDEEIYKMSVELQNSVEYTPTRLLEEDEWYRISDFSQKKFCIEFLKREFNTTDYTLIDKSNADSLEYICSYQNEVYFFQRIMKHNILIQKRITIGEKISLNKGEKSIVINELPDAIYNKCEDNLYFKKIETIAPIFRGIEELYKEATREEVENFLAREFINPINEYGVDKVKTLNRKRIALAMSTLNGFNEQQKRDVLDYTHQYYPRLEYNNGAFSVGSEEDMKYLLWGIEQRYYTTPVTSEPRVAKSVMVLNSVKNT